MKKIGIIGAGRIGKVHTEAVQHFVKDAVVKAIADPFMDEQTKQRAKNIGVQNVYNDYKQILNDDEIEIVLICSSTDTHSKISLEAIEAGKHVFCEKPIDHDISKIKKVIEALEKHKVKYQVGFQRRFDRNFLAAQKQVADGTIGKLSVLKITSRDPGPPPVEYIKVSGGIFLDMTIHDFDMVRFISGDEVEEVYAMGSVTVDPKIGEAGDIDTAVITLKLKNGAIAVIDNCRKATYGYDQRIEAFGSEGMVSVGNCLESTAVVSNGKGVTAEKPQNFFLERYMEAYANEIVSFIEAVVNDTPTKVNVYDGLKPVLIGLAAKESLATGLPVSIKSIESKYNI